MYVLYLSMFLFFKQKTAYEMRISDWISDVCSSDLVVAHFALQRAVAVFKVQVDARVVGGFAGVGGVVQQGLQQVCDGRLDPQAGGQFARAVQVDGEIGRASCRVRVCQYV